MNGWQIALTVLAALAALIALLLFSPIRLTVVSHNTDFRLRAGYLFFRYRIFPKKIRWKKKKKEEREPEPETKPAEEEAKSEKSLSERLSGINPSAIEMTLNRISISLEPILDAFPKTFVMKAKRVVIRIGGRSPDEIALATAGVANALTFLFGFLDCKLMKVSYGRGRRDETSVIPDYLSERCSCELKLILSARLIRLIPLALRSLSLFLSEKKRIERNKRIKEQKQIKDNKEG